MAVGVCHSGLGADQFCFAVFVKGLALPSGLSSCSKEFAGLCPRLCRFGCCSESPAAFPAAALPQPPAAGNVQRQHCSLAGGSAPFC